MHHDLTQIARDAAEEFVEIGDNPSDTREQVSEGLTAIFLRHLKPVEEELADMRCDLEHEEASVQWWRDFAARGDNRDDLPHHGGCICKYVYDENKKPKWTIDPKCKYHATAAKYPSNHAIPWNCPTYWDGCNCNQRIRTLESELARLRCVIAKHDLCHDLHGKVGAREFADGCAAEQRKLYGCAPDADELAALRAENARLRKLVDPVQHAGNDMEPDEYPGNSPAAGGE